MAERFKPVLIGHLDQTGESDIGFLDRRGRDHDALVSVKGAAPAPGPLGYFHEEEGRVRI